NGEDLDSLLPEVFAAIREIARRRLGQYPYEVQIMGAIVLHQGRIAEMTTGEGKTLTATMPMALNALTGKGAHVVTVNDYLAGRDAVWMAPIYEGLGLTVASLSHAMPNLERRLAYAGDILYGTNSEFGFDYLRDNMVFRLEDKVQRGHPYAIVDEVDSILVDEARTPLIISGPPAGETGEYGQVERLVRSLCDDDVDVEEKSHSVTLTEQGVDKVQKAKGIENLYDFEHSAFNQKLSQGLKARWLYEAERDYILKDGEVIIVDEFTGRLMFGRRYGDGLHQAIEAKERVTIRAETLTVATVTIQNYFRLYKKLAGMTGTAKTEEREFIEIYNMDVVQVPTNRPMCRNRLRDLVYKKEADKFAGAVNAIKECFLQGQPVLVGTLSIEKSERLSRLLKRASVPHQVLNAKQHEREASIIAQAGRWQAVTIATNMAGRGTDILLGGNPEYLARDILAGQGVDVTDDIPPEEWGPALEKAEKACAQEAEKVKAAGGLHVLGTERHEARRIDNQLRGRSGRQGDPGSSQFLLSLEDDIMRRFAVDRVEVMMNRFDWPDDEPLWHKLLDNMIENVQKRVEGHHYEVRKSLLKYDDVLNEQRSTIYRERVEVLKVAEFLPQVKGFIEDLVKAAVEDHASPDLPREEWNLHALFLQLSGVMPLPADVEARLQESEDTVGTLRSLGVEALERRREELTSEVMDKLARWAALRAVDSRWMHHLTEMGSLRDGVSMRGYGRVDPLTIYAKEAFDLFGVLIGKIQGDIVRAVFMARIQTEAPKRRGLREAREIASAASARGRESVGSPAPAELSRYETGGSGTGKVGRNDPCPCGSGKKFKHCHGG
ncbi:preprotein translocase subunit SecA, partial [bacterium]|nr:preprotein translocase subunit SecA [bacterium]